MPPRAIGRLRGSRRQPCSTLGRTRQVPSTPSLYGQISSLIHPTETAWNIDDRDTEPPNAVAPTPIEINPGENETATGATLLAEASASCTERSAGPPIVTKIPYPVEPSMPFAMRSGQDAAALQVQGRPCILV